jgi:hypothetical protein
VVAVSFVHDNIENLTAQLLKAIQVSGISACSLFGAGRNFRKDKKGIPWYTTSYTFPE